MEFIFAERRVRVRRIFLFENKDFERQDYADIEFE